MRIGLISGMLACYTCMSAQTRQPDSVRTVSLQEVVVSESYAIAKNRLETQHLDVIGKDFLRLHLSGALMQTLEQLPGVQSMDIGSGFSKPMIRGMGFNRVSVTENGIKQEGQQWGADHGLELDALHVEQVNIRKGPASLLYGSDAMGGVVEIRDLPAPAENQIFGEGVVIGKSVNESLGGSLLLGLKQNNWYTRMRYTEHRFGDYRIPADSVLYLTQRLPVYNRKLKNTAGVERDFNGMVQYRNGNYSGKINLSNVYQKSGFFPGAHGIPDASRLEDDGDSRNIGFPFSKVNHLKVTGNHQYRIDRVSLSADIGWQQNHREEWSRFHSHYGNQTAPTIDPDKELQFRLNSYTLLLKAAFETEKGWSHTAGVDLQMQRNRIAGYSFLLPRYNRESAGLFWVQAYPVSPTLRLSGGIRYDLAHLDLESFTDPYLAEYLRKQQYPEEVIAAYEVRSAPLNRTLGDFSGAFGMVWEPHPRHLLKVNLGRSFRLPSANELASNGVHHGTFRHEQGSADLGSERGWQLDGAYTYRTAGFEITASPFVSWFDNYIYLRPTGEWSVLPHAGQIYRYTGAEALFAGGEVSVCVGLPFSLSYEASGEYVYTRNLEEHTPLSFSPPPSMRHTLRYQRDGFDAYFQYQAIGAQNRVARNEERTPGANLLHGGVSYRFRLGMLMPEVNLTVRNILNTRYYNHLSFYRKVEIPEPGRAFQLMIKVPFKQLLK